MADDPTQGAQGKTGKTGGPGGQGERGRTGDVGRVGDTGKTGDTGASGGSGREGRAGDPGEKGKTGPMGPPGDAGPKGSDGQTSGEHQRVVVEETLRQIAGRQNRRLWIKSALLGFVAALVVMVPASIIIGHDLASVDDLEKIAKRNCTNIGTLAVIFEQETTARAAQNQRFLRQGSTFGMTPAQLKRAIADSAARDALKVAGLQRLARTECPGQGYGGATTTNVTTIPRR